MVDDTLSGRFFFSFAHFTRMTIGYIMMDPEFPRLVLRVERKVGEKGMSGELPVCECGAAMISVEGGENEEKHTISGFKSGDWTETLRPASHSLCS